MKDPIILPDDLVALTVLAFLVERPMHIYEVHRLIRQRGKSFIGGLPRSLYRAVERLERAGLVEVAETEKAEGRPERTVYRATNDGAAELRTWLFALLSGAVEGEGLFNAAVSFLPFISPKSAQHHLRLRIGQLEGRLAPAETTLREVGAYLPRLYLLEVEHERVLYQAELDWLREVVEQIRSGELNWTPPTELVEEA